MLLLDNFRYEQDKLVSSPVYWKCEDCSCPGDGIRHESNLPNTNKQHNLDEDEIKSKVAEM